MLLIVTQRGDLHADWVAAELGRRDVAFVRFNTEDYPERVGLAWSGAGAASLRLQGRDWDVGGFDSVWYRRPAAPTMPPGLPAAEARWAAAEAREALLGLWRTMDALWVNHPDRNRVAESKPLQLRTAKRLGFKVPATLITNQPDIARAFLEEHPQGAICKPLHDGRIPAASGERVFFTSRIGADDAAIDRLGLEPYVFQQLIEKRCDVRVTVMGDELFAVAIDSQQLPEARVDWRKGAHRELAHRPIRLPDRVAGRCLALCREMQLNFGAIDLAEDTDGDYSFFEINPNGQWAWIEQLTGLPMRDQLIALLLGAGGVGGGR